MTQFSPNPTPDALRLFRQLCRHGGSSRVRPLQAALGMDAPTFIDCVTDLEERFWIGVVWRKGLPDSEADSRPYTEAERLCLTWFGRRKRRAMREEVRGGARPGAMPLLRGNEPSVGASGET